MYDDEDCRNNSNETNSSQSRLVVTWRTHPCSTQSTYSVRSSLHHLLLHKVSADSPLECSWQFFVQTYRSGGLSAINKGVNAVALRQITNWGSRIGIARAAEEGIKDVRGYSKEHKLGLGEKVASSALGGLLGCWNHPIEGTSISI